MNEALNEWLDKTDWVQKTAHPTELGLHRADVIKARYDALVGALQDVVAASDANCGDSLANAINAARAVIAKATGESK